MALNLKSGAEWNTSMPLGEYGLSHDGSATRNVTPYVWVTASGVCTDNVIEASPPSGCNGSSVNVTAS